MPFTSDKIIKTAVSVPVAKPISAITATEYTGEWVNWAIGQTVQREFIAPKNTFYRPGNAIVFGNGMSRTPDLLSKISQSNGNKILKFYNTLYACNSAHKDVAADFYVITNKLIASRVAKDLHTKCFTRPEILRIHKQMNLIPVYYTLDAGSTAALLACFHGATQVFLVGFDGCPDHKNNNIYAGTEFYPSPNDEVNDESWSANLEQIVAAYPSVKFHRVNANPPSARRLLRYPNYQVINLKTFISLADI